MGVWFHLAWRSHRTELKLLGAAVIGSAVAALVLAVMMGRLQAIDPGCFTPWTGTGEQPEPSAACQRLFVPYYQDLTPWADRLMLALLSAPFAIGLILGVPVVAAEVEHGTAAMSWMLSTSRVRWLMIRVIPIAGFTAVALIVLSLADGPLEVVLGQDIGFWRKVQPWPLLALRGLLALGIGVAAGAVVGRILPALFVGILVCAATFGAIAFIIDGWEHAEAVALLDSEPCAGCSRFFDEGYRDETTGRVVTTHEYFGVPEGEPVFQAGGPVPGMAHVVMRVPASRYPDFFLRESGLTAACAVAFMSLTAVAIQHRRPY